MFGIVVLLGTLSNAALGDFGLKRLIHGLIEAPLSQDSTPIFLTRYRKSLGFSPLPAPNEPTPLLTKTLGKGPITSARHVRRIVQTCFDAAYYWMKDDGLEDDAWI